ncbi:MAG: cyclic nucleotide-binding domain-containing protein [Acidobacteriota bacterium]|nr:cyclic nucleotide-binding domain-containing protein [Acidobacteriota bacterium]
MASDVFRSLTVSYKAGERIVAAGERGGCLFVVNAGSVRLREPGAGEGHPSRLLGKGDFFGESALLEGQPYGVNAEAETDCEVVELGPSVFQRLLEANPEFAVRMMRKMAAARREFGRPAPDAPAAKEAGTVAPASSATGRLVLDGGGAIFPLQGEQVLVGRYDPVTEIQPEIDLTGVDTHRSVSRRHSRLTRSSEGWMVAEEVGALNGTFVNGVRLAPGQQVLLRDGDVVSFGMVRVVYREAE